MAQDILLTKPRSLSNRCICSRQFSSNSRLPSVRSRGRPRRSQDNFVQGPRFCSPQRYQATRLIGSENLPPRVASSNFFGDKIASRTSHVCKQKKTSRGAQGLGMRAEEHHQSTPDPIRGACGSLRETGKDQNQVKAPRWD